MLSQKINLKTENFECSSADLVDRAELLARLEVFRRDWKVATRGKMRSVTLDLKLLLDDIDRIVEKCKSRE